MEELNSEISRQEIIQKCCDSYRACRKIVEKGKTAPDFQKYKSKHQGEYRLHDTLKQQLQALGVNKLPTSEQLQVKINSLKKKYSSVRKEKQDLEKRHSTLISISANFNALLFDDTPYKASSTQPQKEYDL